MRYFPERETAVRLAERGSKVVVAARNEPGLRSLVSEIEANGGQAAYAVCDVADFGQVQAVADTTVRTFGRNRHMGQCCCGLRLRTVRGNVTGRVLARDAS
ncbi:MAG: SDR family NAD(P)-dependent oxidoreductase [Bryobacteraceae bacterium]